LAAARLSDGLSAGLRVRGAQGCIGALFLDLLHSSSLFSAVRGARTATAAVRMRGGGRLQRCACCRSLCACSASRKPVL